MSWVKQDDGQLVSLTTHFVPEEDKSASTALKNLSHVMQKDPEYAHSWHCNIAMMAQDAGASHESANKRAADFMRNSFGVKNSQESTFLGTINKYCAEDCPCRSKD
jgi:Tfp pilus assembly protein PilF